jgi:hypothetical protein
MGSRRTAENFETQARANARAERAKVRGPGEFRWRHHAPTDASMKRAMQTSLVA